MQIAPALQVAVQRAYYDAMQQLHTALLNVCADFQGENYSKVSRTPPHVKAQPCISNLLAWLTHMSCRRVTAQLCFVGD